MSIISRRSARIAATASSTLALAAAALLAPAAAQAAAPGAPLLAHDGPHACAVTGGELSWGVKESFRSYISGSIAKGEWQVSDGASYATPLFGWSNATGEIDEETGEGAVRFTGAVHFTGHDGVLDLTIANPTIELRGDGTARLLMDTRSNDAQGQLKIDERQAYLGKIEGIGQKLPANGALAFEKAPAILTADGAKAFGDFYGSGDPLDPVTLALRLEGCVGNATGGANQGQQGGNGTQATAEPILVDAQSSVPWLPIAVGGGAVVVIGVTAGMLIAGRKKSAASPEA